MIESQSRFRKNRSENCKMLVMFSKKCDTVTTIRDGNCLPFWGRSGEKNGGSVNLIDLRRSPQELSNDCLVANFYFDTAENESLKVCQEVGLS